MQDLFQWMRQGAKRDQAYGSTTAVGLNTVTNWHVIITEGFKSHHMLGEPDRYNGLFRECLPTGYALTTTNSFFQRKVFHQMGSKHTASYSVRM